MVKIYTKTGDKGYSSLGRKGERYSKSHEWFELLGDIDEVTSFLGLAASCAQEGDLKSVIVHIQKLLYKSCAHLAEYETFDPKLEILDLEKKIDDYSAQMTELTSFIIPGGSAFSSHTYVARAVCRRAERKCVGIAERHPHALDMVPLLNRISDFLFVIARFGNFKSGISEEELSFS